MTDEANIEAPILLELHALREARKRRGGHWPAHAYPNGNLGALPVVINYYPPVDIAVEVNMQSATKAQIRCKLATLERLGFLGCFK